MMESGSSDAQIAVYLSYSGEDERDVAPVKSGLVDAGFDVYPTFAPPGTAWAQWYRDQLDKAEIVVIILTERYLFGSFVYAELAEALDSGKRIVPVVLHRGSEIPAVLRGYQPVDLSDLADRDNQLQRLIAALRDQVSAPIDTIDELAKIAAQERLIRLETEVEAHTIERIRALDGDKLINASKSAARISSGVVVGAVLFGP